MPYNILRMVIKKKKSRGGESDRKQNGTSALKEVGRGRTWATYEGQRVEMGVGWWRRRWSDSLCTKRITFISGKPRVAPNCNQFFVFLLQPHSSLTLCLARPHSIRGPLSSVPFSSVLNWSVPAPSQAVFRSFVRPFVRSFVRSFVQDGWRYPVQPEFASGIPLFAFQFRETLATAATAAAAAAKRRVQT